MSPVLLSPVEIPADYSKVPPDVKPKLDRQRLASKEDALRFLDKHSARIELVIRWLSSRGAPQDPEIHIQFSPNPGIPEQSYFNIHLVFSHKGEQAQHDMVLAIWRPTFVLWSLANKFESLRIQDRPWWDEDTDIPKPPEPIPRPISEYVDQKDPDCMLSRGVPYDRFQYGARWIDPDGTVFVKERAQSFFSSYARWRRVAKEG